MPIDDEMSRHEGFDDHVLGREDPITGVPYELRGKVAMLEHRNETELPTGEVALRDYIAVRADECDFAHYIPENVGGCVQLAIQLGMNPDTAQWCEVLGAIYARARYLFADEMLKARKEGEAR